MKNVILYFILLLSIGCRSDLPKPTSSEPYLPRADSNVYIVNEGPFGSGSGSISYYNSKTGIFVEDIYNQVNGSKLGNVCQSMCIVNDTGYIVVNNANKVVIVSMPEFKEIGTIKGLTSPRYFLPINKDKAYVTDLYSNAIAVIDLNTNTVFKNIPCNGSTEELIIVGKNAYVTNTRTDKIYVINSDNDQVEDSITVGFCSSSLREDNAGKIWVYCTGDLDKKINAGIYQVDPATKKVLKKFNLNNPLNTWDRMDINNSLDTIYYLNNGVYRLPISANALPLQPIIASEGRNFYGIGIDPNTGEIYVSDAKDFSQKGIIYRYKKDLSGNIILETTFKASTIPSDFVFYK